MYQNGFLGCWAVEEAILKEKNGVATCTNTWPDFGVWQFLRLVFPLCVASTYY